MDKNLLEKLFAFLSGYQTLYGDEIFLDDRRLYGIMSAYSTPSPDQFPVVREKEETAKRKEIHTMREDFPLWQFKDEIQNCLKCPLGNTRNKFVFGEGNPNADIMFIGEAPGADEDRTGIPFIGRAGQLLNNLLAAIHVDRKSVFIANILKCRPPNNRDPQTTEVQECIPYLHRQIELIQPKVIVALGRVAAQNLLESNSSLKSMRERLWQYQGVTMIVTYHPAAILRNPGLLEAARQDFKFILKSYHDVKKHQI